MCEVFFFVGILFSLVLLSGFGSAVGTYPAVDPSMVLYYHFNNNSLIGENDTFVVDSSTASNNGTANNTQFKTGTGILGDGSFMFLNNSKSFVKVNNSLYWGVDMNLTFTFWINVTTLPSTTAYLISKDGDGGVGSMNIDLSTAGKIETRLGQGSGINDQTILNDSKWHFVAVTFSRQETNGMKIYIDGLLRTSSDTFNKTANLSTNPLYIGRRATNGYFNGSLDEIIIYNRSLSESEIWGNYMNYIECINLVSATSFKFYNKICPNSFNYNGSFLVQSTYNNTYINFTGSYFYGNDSGTLMQFNAINNITIEGLNASGYNYVIRTVGVNGFNFFNGWLNTRRNGWLLIDSTNNTHIYNSKFGYFNNSNTIGGIYFRFSAVNITLENSFLKNVTDGGAIRFYNITNGNNINVINNSIIGGSSKLIEIINSNNILIKDNNLSDSNNNFDSYNVGIHIYSYKGIDFSQNISINNNSFLDIGCTGILSQGVNNLNIFNNYFNYNYNLSSSRNSNCGYEGITAIDLASIWKTWTSDNTENVSDTVRDILNYSSTNVNISGNSINNYPVLLRASSPINLTNDLNNYWFRSFASPSYLMPKQDYYLSDNFSYVFTTFNETIGNPVILRDILGVGYPGYSTGKQKMYFKIYNNYLYFENGNETLSYNSSLFNQTNSLIYFSNGSVACSDIATCDGNINITIQPNNYSYVLDNFNVTEGVIRQFSPISVSGISTSKTITSTLSQGVNASVILIVAKCPISATYQSISYTYDSCSGGQVTYSLKDIPNGNSIITLGFAGGTPTLNECDAKTGLALGIASFSKISNIAPVLITVTLIVYLIFGFKVYRRSGNPKLEGVENIWNAFISLVMFGSLGAVFALVLITNIPC